MIVISIIDESCEEDLVIKTSAFNIGGWREEVEVFQNVEKMLNIESGLCPD